MVSLREIAKPSWRQRAARLVVKNALMGTCRALIQDAIDEGRRTVDPFPRRFRWPKAKRPKPFPCSVEEKQRVVQWFMTRPFGRHPGRSLVKNYAPHLAYAVYVHVLFWTGMRPSEASALDWDHVDLLAGTATVAQSYHLGEVNDPKTESSHRTLELYPETVRLLRLIRSADPAPGTPVFTTTTGSRIEPKTFDAFWRESLDALKITMRGLYCTKDTFVWAHLRSGVKIAWLENQTGDSYATLRKHYGKWIADSDRSEQAKIAQLNPRPLLDGPPSVARVEREKEGPKGPPMLPTLEGSGYQTSEELVNSLAYGVRGGGLEPPRVLPH